MYVYRSGCCRDTICTSRFNLGSDRISMTKPIRVALRSTHFKNNPFISDITIVFILYAISPSRVDRGAEMGRNPYIFVPAERVRRARRGTEGAHRAPQTLPRPDRLLILPTPSTHRHTALSPPTAASSFPPSLSPSLGKRSGGQQSRRAASLSLALVFCFFPPWPYHTRM